MNLTPKKCSDSIDFPKLNVIFIWFQLQVNLQNDIQQPDSGIDTSSLDNAADDDIDAALSELQLTLGGSNGHSKTSDITHIPELTDYLRYLRCVPNDTSIAYDIQ